MDIDREIGSLLAELHYLTDGLKAYGTVEAAMRLRALAELAAHTGTDALLTMAATASIHAPVAGPRAA